MRKIVIFLIIFLLTPSLLFAKNNFIEIIFSILLLKLFQIVGVFQFLLLMDFLTLIPIMKECYQEKI